MAFAVVFLGPVDSALLALAFIGFNAYVLPRFRNWLWRSQEIERGRSVGIVLYPTTVLLVVLIFRHRLEIAAAVWGILAFGDGMAALLGQLFGRTVLPWNPKKTWVGTISYWIFGSLAAAGLLGWTMYHGTPHHAAPGSEIRWPFLAFVALVAALFAAWLESQPQELDDNLSVPLLTGLLLLGLLSTETNWTSFELQATLRPAVTGALVNLLFAAAAFKARSIDLSGAAAGCVLGTTIYAFLGWRGFIVLGSFFVLTTAATRMGYQAKVSRGLAQTSGGRRRARHAIANSGVAAILAIFAVTTPYGASCSAAFVAAFAAATSDTLESEIGQLWGRQPVLVTTFRRVPRGTDGAVSLEGTVAGLVGAGGIAVLGWTLGFYPPSGIWAVAVAGYLGSVADSLAGATLEHRGLLDNEGVNFVGTLSGALIAVGLTLM